MKVFQVPNGSGTSVKNVLFNGKSVQYVSEQIIYIRWDIIMPNILTEMHLENTHSKVATT